MTFAESKKIPELRVDFNSLLSHSFLQRVFLPDPENLSVEELMIRHWFTDSIISACKVYDEIRNLILNHELQDQIEQGYLTMYFLDVPRHLESLISILKRISDAVNVLSKNDHSLKSIYERHLKLMKGISTIRNNFEHFNRQLNNEKLAMDAVNIVFFSDGEEIGFRKDKIKTIDLVMFIEDIFIVISGMYPNLKNANLMAVSTGQLRLSISSEIKLTTK